jgi:UDP-N-acetylmuramoyl-tripeptide--D-alanyl-D-alanine ligase
MDPRQVAWVLESVGEASLGGEGNGVIGGVSTDSRTTREGDLFVALKGDRTDGHRHVAEALHHGASAALISSDLADLGGFGDRAVIRVPDTRVALGRIAARYRSELDVRIVAVTGSNGKTTTKDLTARVLEAAGTVVKAAHSYNNDIGLPLTLLSMGSTTRFGVVEMGTNHPGEIARLCRIAAPDVGIVTTVSEAHLEGLGGLAEVAEEKGALVEALPPHGMAFINWDNWLCQEMERRACCPVVRCGFDTSADLWGTMRKRRPSGIAFHLYAKVEIVVPFPGFHNASNALFAIGVGLHAGLPATTIRDRLAGAVLPDMRMAVSVVGGVTLINDAYNANPGSVEAAILELEATRTTGRRILVLGEMGELGERSADLHREAGRQAGDAGISAVWAIGPHAGDVEKGLSSVERWNGSFWAAADTAEALSGLPFDVETGDTVLVKGSRRMQMERVFDRIREMAARTGGRVKEAVGG